MGPSLVTTVDPSRGPPVEGAARRFNGAVVGYDGRCARRVDRRARCEASMGPSLVTTVDTRYEGGHHPSSSRFNGAVVGYDGRWRARDADRLIG